MAVEISEFVDFVKNLTITEASQLVRTLESELGVSVQSQSLRDRPPDPTPVAPPDWFEVVLTEVGDRRIDVIRTLRVELALPLRQVRDRITSLPATLWEGADPSRAKALAGALADMGAVVECRSLVRG